MNVAGVRRAFDLAPAWAARLAVAFAAWAIVLELARGSGFIAAIASTPGALLLGGAGVLLAASAMAPLLPGAKGGGAVRAARLLWRGGLALLLIGPPLSLRASDARSVRVGEGMELPPGWLPDLPPVRISSISVAPGGPHLLSKQVEVEAIRESGEPIRIGLFPPAGLGAWRLAVFQFGYAPGIEWSGEGGRQIAEGYVMLGTFPKSEEEARLVAWSPEPNVMMGVGTFPPKLEDLLTPRGSRDHLFLRIASARVAGAERDLTGPDAWKWLMQGRLEDPVYFAQVFRGAEKVFEGRVRGGEEARYSAGRLLVTREVVYWADLQASRNPGARLVAAGAPLLAAGAALALGAAIAGRVRRRRARASLAPPPDARHP